MNKSTPISQLPAANPTPVFVNDQQRQFITQAQQAISNTTMPQNTQSSSDIVNDDDMVVQDILNQINSSNGGNEQQPDRVQNENQINQLYMQQQQMQQQQFMPQPHMQPQGQNIPPHFLYQMAAAGGGNVPPNFTVPEAMINQPIPNGPMDYKTFMHYFADDFKLASLIFIATIVVHFIPLEKFVGKYIALDRIPYHEILFRAIMISIVVIIIKKLVKI